MQSSRLRKPIELPFQILLRIKHPSLDPSEITSTLKLQPEHCAAVGQAVSEAGRPTVRSESYWLATLPTLALTSWLTELRSMTEQPARLSTEARRSLFGAVGLHDAQLLAWLREFQPHAAFFKRIVHEQGSVTLVLQRVNRTAPMTITPLLAQRLAELHVGLEID